MRILVLGAGIGGLGASIALRQQGFGVDLVEIKPELSLYGVGINQPANSLRALDSLGVLDEIRAVGCEFDHTDFYAADGELIVHVPCILGGDDVPANTALSRLNLHRILIGAAERHDVKISYGTTMEQFTDTARAVDVRFTDGRQESYNLVAAFDGIKSATRRAVFGPARDAVYSGFGVFRLTLPRPEYVDGVRVYQALGVKAGYIPLSKETMYMFVVTPDPAGVSHRPEDFAGILRSRMAPFGALPGQVRDGLRPTDEHRLQPDLRRAAPAAVVLRADRDPGRRRARVRAAPDPGGRDGAGGRHRAGRDARGRRPAGGPAARLRGAPVSPGPARPGRLPRHPAGRDEHSTPTTMARRCRACATTWWNRRTSWRPS